MKQLFSHITCITALLSFVLSGSTTFGKVDLPGSHPEAVFTSPEHPYFDSNPDGNGINTGHMGSDPYADSDATAVFSTSSPHTDARENLFISSVDGEGGDITPLVVSTATAGSGDKGQQVFLTEGFDDGNLSSRGWYDNTNLTIDNTEYHSGGGSVKFHFAKGAGNPDSGGAIRHKFTATGEMYVSYYVKYSDGYQGSGNNVHPHEFFILSDRDGDWTSPNYSYLQVKIEQNALRPRVIFRDDKFVNTSYGKPEKDLTGITEDRAVHGCNGEQDNISTDCYQSGGRWYNSKHFLHPAALISTNEWHKVAVYVKLNTVTDTTTNADGIMQYRLDDTLVFDYDNLVIRTSARPAIKFNQFGIAPFIGQGSPVDQSFWVDDLVIADAPGDSTTPTNTRKLNPGSGEKGSCMGRVYPNPSNTNITLSGDARWNGKAGVTIYTLYGRKIFDTPRTVTFPYQVDVSAFRAGIYIVKVSNEDEYFTRQVKVIKE